LNISDVPAGLNTETPVTHSLWEHTSTAILSLDHEGIIRTANPASAALFGYSSNELVGTALTNLLDAFSRDKARAMLVQATTYGSALNWELDVQIPGHPPKLLSFSVDCLENSNSSVGDFVLTCCDISTQLELTARLASVNQQLEGALLDLEKTHHKLQETQTQLVQSEKMRSLGQLVSGVAHEINNPLGFIKNNLTLLSEAAPRLELIRRAAQIGPLSEKDLKSFENFLEDLREISQENLEGLTRIESIVLALRNFSRLDEANYKLADLSEGLLSTLRLAHTSIENRIHLDVKMEPLPLTYCQPGEINQVFMNLLLNAMHAIPGKGVITIRAHAENDLILFEFQDNGTGMSPEVLTHLGEPFFTTRPVGEGTGLGLAISMGIVNRHHGRLLFSSQPGQGTIATLEIPIRHFQENR